MRVEFNSFSKAIEKIKGIMVDKADKADNIGILFDPDVDTGKMILAYTDGRKAVCNRLDITTDDGEVVDRNVVVSQKVLNDIIEICKPSGVLNVDNLDISFDTEARQIRFSVEKFIWEEGEGGTGAVEMNSGLVGVDDIDGVMNPPEVDGDVVESGVDHEGGVASDSGTMEEAGYSKKVMSRLHQTVRYTRVSDDRRHGILSKLDYNTMLAVGAGVGDEVVEGAAIPDEWGRMEFVKVLGKLSYEDDKLVIFSGQRKSAAVANLNYVVYLGREEIQNSLCLPAKMCKCIIDVLRKAEGDKVYVLVQNGYCTISNDKCDTSIWLETSKPYKMTLQAINGYDNVKFDTYRIVVLREALLNIAKCCKAVGESSNVKLKFISGKDGAVQLRLDGVSSASKDNDFSVELTEVEGSIEELCATSYEVGMDTILTMLSLCDSTYCGLYIDMQSDGVEGGRTLPVLKLSDLQKSGGATTEVLKSYAMLKG